MNIKKLFSVAAVVTFLGSTFLPGLALAATPDTELGKAYEWAYSKGITTKDTYEAANMTAPITRAEMAKMLANWAKSNGATPDTTKSCTFTDTASVGGDLAVAIVEACQLGLMGQGITAFRPYDTITRAEFGTALSRALWGETYGGGTPYYAGHLNALKTAGIMTVIANAETMKEVRGYVMLMLMRSENETPSICEETDVKVICAVEEAAEEYKDCPAACRKDNSKEEEKDSDEVVKSGDLAVSATAGEGRNVIVPTAAAVAAAAPAIATSVSDMDTLTFKTSEEVELSKVVLERYGYSANADVANVWLEDEDGNVISNKASLNTKGQANLTIKKDYRAVDGTYNATIVVEAKNSGAGGTIGFKVIDVTSTAKNVDLGNYKPYTYDMVAYDGSSVTISARWGEKNYNFEASKYFEVSKFKIKAPSDSAILVKGFTLTNDPTIPAVWAPLDVEKYLDKVVVKVDGKEVDASAELNKDDNLVVSFDKDLEIASKWTVEVTIEMSFSEDFDGYRTWIYYYINGASDFSAIDAKTESRVNPDFTAANYLAYYFEWGKVKLTNTKLGNVEYGLDSTDVVVAEGNITIWESIKWNLTVNVTNPAAWTAIKAMRLKVSGDEYEWTPNPALTTFTFSNVEIEESGKIQFLVDIADAPAALEGKDVTFTIAGWNTFYYTEGRAGVDFADISGSISASRLTIQAAKASLTKDLTKDVEFKNNESNRKVVFEGTYTAKKWDIKLNEFNIEWSAAWLATYLGAAANKVTFYLSIDGDEVADTVLAATTTAGKYAGKDTFSNIEVAAGKTVKVVVEAEIDDHVATTAMPANGYDLGVFTVTLKWEDENGNTAGQASKNTVKLKVVESGTAKISTSSAAKNTVLLKGSDSVLAEFIVKPSNTSSEIDLDELVLSITPTTINPADVTVTIDGVEEDVALTDGSFTYRPTTKLKSEWVTIKVTLDDEDKATGIVDLDITKLNTETPTGTATYLKRFSKRFEEALVYLTKQTNQGDYTDYVLGVEKYDDSDTVTGLELFSDTACTASATTQFVINGIAVTDEIDDGDKFSIDNGTTSQTIKCIKYKINWVAITTPIDNALYSDYFKIGDEAWRVFSNNK